MSPDRSTPTVTGGARPRGWTTPPVALTIAGSDAGAGAGLQADLKTMSALGVFATTVVTAVTAQNTRAVTDVVVLTPEAVEAQLDAVLDDFDVLAVKTGMLASSEIVALVARRAAAGDLPGLVVDPVVTASSGRPLLPPDGLDAYRRHLLPHALLTTPNLWEAALLVGREPGTVRDAGDMEELARAVHDLGPRWVLVKGGHLPGVHGGDATRAPAAVSDVLFDGTTVTVLTAPYVDTANNHGTGCSTASAVAAGLATGRTVPDAVAAAKEYVHRALVGGAGWRLGGGHGPIDHFGWGPAPE